MTLGYVLCLCCNLNEIRVFWHFTSFPNRVLACPSQDDAPRLELQNLLDRTRNGPRAREVDLATVNRS